MENTQTHAGDKCEIQTQDSRGMWTAVNNASAILEKCIAANAEITDTDDALAALLSGKTLRTAKPGAGDWYSNVRAINVDATARLAEKKHNALLAAERRHNEDVNDNW